MATKLHSQVVEGSRHAIHNLTYANAANRIAGTGEGSGINPPTADNLWQIAKQNDDDSLWMLVDESPLTWKQIPVGVSGTPTTDDTYNNFGSNPSTVVVDAAQGQGTALKFDMSSAAADRFFEVALDNGQNPTGDPAVYHTGFTVTNGTDNWTVARAGADQINLVGAIENILLEVANIFQIETDSVELKLLSDVASGNFVDLFGDGKLTGASGTQRYLDIAPAINQSGTAGYDGLRVNPAITAVGSGEQNLLNLQLGGANRFRVASDGNTRIGTGTPGSATGAGAAYVTGALECDGLIYSDGGVSVASDKIIDSGVGALAGSIKPLSPAQTPGTSLLLTGTAANSWILCEQADAGYNFAHSLQTNPTLFIHSASQSTTEWLSLAHDQTHARLLTGTGAVCVGTGTPNFAIGLGDIYATGDIECDADLHSGGNAIIVGYVQTSATFRMPTNGRVYNTTGGSSFYSRNSNQANPSGILTTGTESEALILCQDADANFNFAHSLQTNPTLFGHSANQSTTEWWSLTHDQTHARLVTGAGAVCIGTGTPSAATGVGDFFVTDDAEVGGDLVLSAASLIFTDGYLSSGSPISTANTSQSTVSGFLYTGTGGLNGWVICEYPDRTFDFAHSAQTNPTLFGHSANQSTTEWWSLTHDQTDAVWGSGAGALSLQPATGVIKYPDAGQTLYDIAPASDHTATGDTVSATVDTNATGIAAALYQASDGNWDEAKADSISTMPCRALALETGTGTKLILRRGWIRDDSWAWTPGAPVYMSTTTGALTQTKPSTTGDQVQIVGYAETADILDFNPSMTIVEVA